MCIKQYQSCTNIMFFCLYLKAFITNLLQFIVIISSFTYSSVEIKFLVHIFLLNRKGDLYMKNRFFQTSYTVRQLYNLLILKFN